jgi:hypothetical protein
VDGKQGFYFLNNNEHEIYNGTWKTINKNKLRTCCLESEKDEGASKTEGSARCDGRNSDGRAEKGSSSSISTGIGRCTDTTNAGARTDSSSSVVGAGPLKLTGQESASAIDTNLSRLAIAI